MAEFVVIDDILSLLFVHKGQLGQGNSINSWIPLEIDLGADFSVKQLVAGSWHNCALSNQSEVMDLHFLVISDLFHLLNVYAVSGQVLGR